jgi:uncharacterized protein
MQWLTDLFHITKPIIAMCHLKALPGDPGYDPRKGMDWIVESARTDLQALQAGGVEPSCFQTRPACPT